jgi:OPA family glycerol-3-phosphate transporter-like MFS transporter 1/2
MSYALFQGVVEYSLSLFFAKLVSYTFLYWLPLYIKSSSKCVSALCLLLFFFLFLVFEVGLIYCNYWSKYIVLILYMKPIVWTQKIFS